MRFIHTSDLHIGKSIHHRERYDECRAVLEEIAAYAEKEAVDLVVIAGDLFDQPTPPAEAEKVAYSFFSRLNRAAIPIVVIAGNHDSYERFDSRTDLFAIANVNVFGTPKKDAVQRIVTRKGETAVIGCLPFLSPRFMLKAHEIFDLSQGEMKASYSEKVGRAIDVLSKNFQPGAVNILVSHLFLQGAIPSRSEKAFDTSSIFEVATPAIPRGAQYCCLGHIHKQQKLPRASAPAYYSGSVMKLDFGEEDDEKGFLVVEAFPDIPPKIEFIKLDSVLPLITAEVQFKELEKYSAEIRKRLNKGYGRVLVKHNQPVPNLAEIIKREIPEAIWWELIQPEVRSKRKSTSVPLNRLMDPMEMFRAYFEEQFEEAPPEEYSKALLKLYEEASVSSEDSES